MLPWWVRVSCNEIWWSCCYAKCFIPSISKELWCYYYQLHHNNTHKLFCTLCPGGYVSVSVYAIVLNKITSSVFIFLPKECKCSLIIRKFHSPVPLGRHPQLREVSSCFSCHYGPFYFKLSKKLQVWYCTTTTSSFFNKYKDNKTWVKINRNKTSFDCWLHYSLALCQ